MCFHSKQTKSAQELEHRFDAKFEKAENYVPSIYNGFRFPQTPVITNKEGNKIQLFNWGLIPVRKFGYCLQIKYFQGIR